MEHRQIISPVHLSKEERRTATGQRAHVLSTTSAVFDLWSASRQLLPSFFLSEVPEMIIDLPIGPTSGGRPVRPTMAIGNLGREGYL